ncbi:MAG TPA: PilZ domain-containing protein [Phototrophicaceae bacterium]|nr:PilZ domain-containing protein [Phototrophicaceae bacterium]
MQGEKSDYRGERRNFLRYPMRSLAYVKLGEENGGIILNLSEDGMAVRAVMGVGHDRTPPLRFPLPNSTDSIAISGRIAWKGDAGKLAGVQFVDMPDPMRDRIRSWVAEENSPRAKREAKTEAAAGESFPAESTLKTTAISEEGREAEEQKQTTRSRGSKWAPADSASIFPPPVMPVASQPVAEELPGSNVSHKRKSRAALLIIVLAVLSVIAGLAIGPFLNHSFPRIGHPKSAEQQPSQSIDSFARVPNVRNQPPPLSQHLQTEGSGQQGWIFLGEITPKSTWAADTLQIVRDARWPIKKGDRITIGHDVWIRDGSRPSAEVVGRVRVGETVSVEEITLLHRRLGGNFVWARVRK